MIHTIDISGYTNQVIPRLDGFDVPLANYKASYPSAIMWGQFMFFHDNVDRGLLIHVADPKPEIQEWFISALSKTLTIEFFSENIPEIRQVYLNTSDWKVAADIYKSWAVDQEWYVKRDNIEFDNLKGYICGSQNTGAALLNHAELSKQLLRDSVAIEATNYRSERFDANYPDYEPLAEFKMAFEALENDGFMVIPYTNGLLWDETRNDYNVNDMVWDVDGNVAQYSSYLPNLKVMCLGVKANEDRLLQECENLGTSGVYIDIINATAPRICHNPNHAHAPGDARQWIDNARSLVKRLGENKHTVLEGWSESCMGLADGYLSVHVDRVNCNIDLISYIYGGVVNKVGWGMHGLTKWPDIKAAQEQASTFSAFPEKITYTGNQYADIEMFKHNQTT